MKVVEHDEGGPITRRIRQEPPDLVEELEPIGLGVDRLRHGRTTPSLRSTAGRFRNGREFGELPAGPPDDLEPRPIARPPPPPPAPSGQYPPAPLLGVLGHRSHQAALPDPRLARDQEERPVT